VDSAIFKAGRRCGLGKQILVNSPRDPASRAIDPQVCLSARNQWPGRRVRLEVFQGGTDDGVEDTGRGADAEPDDVFEVEGFIGGI
jgi:hypothetical protein